MMRMVVKVGMVPAIMLVMVIVLINMKIAVHEVLVKNASI